MEKNRNNQEQNQPANQNGIVTVNDNNNPTPDERDARIGNEPDTERLRSERESVKDGNPDAREISGE
jgi:hypothetical protein